MRHYKKKGLKIGTDPAHTKAMKKSLCQALFLNDRIKTTETRAKAIRGDVDGIITWAKKGDLHSRRLAIAKLGDKDLVAEIFDKAAQGAWADRNGGYTRILKLGPRKGDGAEMVIMELIYEPVQTKETKAASTAAKKKSAAPKKVSKKEEAPAEEEASAEEVPAEEEAPVEEAPAEEAPAEEEAPVEDAPAVDEVPVEEAPVEEAASADAGAGSDAAEEPAAE